MEVAFLANRAFCAIITRIKGANPTAIEKPLPELELVKYPAYHILPSFGLNQIIIN
jgi:hypothetical protein